ncbi:conserved exported hypothetical protein [Candidatus Terasakiella magnetica]|nr:conserved exported hypothetical protein [Candidatus Terasakiella magnetica]
MSGLKMALLAFALVLGALPLAAQEAGGVKIRGNTNVNANAENINTMAIGQGNVAKTNIGVVNSSRSGGTTNVTVDAKNVQNVVGGRGRKGCVNIGVTGADPDCK